MDYLRLLLFLMFVCFSVTTVLKLKPAQPFKDITNWLKGHRVTQMIGLWLWLTAE